MGKEARSLRDDFERKPSDLKRFYAVLKLNEDSWMPHIETWLPKRIGTDTIEWCLALVKHGDKKGWLPDGVQLLAKEGRHGR